MTFANFRELFTQLEQQLWHFQTYWQFQPMQQAALADPYHFLPADFAKTLQQFNLAECAELDADDVELMRSLGSFLNGSHSPTMPTTIPRHPATAVQAPFWLATGISGRKWQQICQFAGAVGQKSLPVLEWCAGKGHLGRVLAGQLGCEVHSLEWQAALCADGQQLADKLQFPQKFHHVDVLQQSTAEYFYPQQQWLALHACGDLHRVGLEQALAAKTSDIALVPCCYHLQTSDTYQHRSEIAKTSRLQLNKADLRLAVQGHATGGARVARLSQQEMAWRHAFWAYAQSQGRSSYQPLRSVSKQIFSAEAATFFAFACEQHQLATPTVAELAEALAIGEQRLLVQRRLELCQHLFRRPLELYLVADLALWLCESGYQVELHELCPASLTPRNLLITATRQLGC